MTNMRITGGKGVHFTFDNGLTISIQIGGGNYSDNYDFPTGNERKVALPASERAEIAVWNADGKWLDLDGDQVAGYVPVSKVLDFVQYLRSLPEGTTTLDTSLIQRPPA